MFFNPYKTMYYKNNANFAKTKRAVQKKKIHKGNANFAWISKKPFHG